jgi:hypothetical protein
MNIIGSAHFSWSLCSAKISTKALWHWECFLGMVDGFLLFFLFDSTVKNKFQCLQNNFMVSLAAGLHLIYTSSARFLSERTC